MLRRTNRQPPNPRDSETTPSGIGGRRTTSVESRWHLAGRRWLWTKIRWEFVRSCSSDAEERTSSVRCCSGFAQSCWEFGKSRLSFVKTRWDWRNSRRVFGDLSRGAAIQPQAGSHSSHRHRRLRPRDFHRHRRRMSLRDARRRVWPGNRSCSMLKRRLGRRAATLPSSHSPPALDSPP